MVEPALHPDLERLQSQLDAIGIAATAPPFGELAPTVQAPAFFRAVQARHTRRVALLYGGIAAALIVIVGSFLLQSWIRNQLAAPTPPSHSLDDPDPAAISTATPPRRDTTDAVTSAWPSVIRLTNANRDADSLQLPAPTPAPATTGTLSTQTFDTEDVQTPRSAPSMRADEK